MKKIFCLTILAVLCTFGVASAQQFPSVQIETQDGKTIDTKTLIDGKTKVEAKVRGDDKVVPAMIELCKKRADGVENFDYMIGHTNIKQAEDLEKACRKAFGKPPLAVFELGGVVSANTGPDTVALTYTGHPRG